MLCTILLQEYNGDGPGWPQTEPSPVPVAHPTQWGMQLSELLSVGNVFERTFVSGECN